jgi:hypothetical protein
VTSIKQPWLDTNGKPIQAHGGGILFFEGVYYWFGENKNGPTILSHMHRVDAIGISCYSSRTLNDWRDEGLVLKAVPNDPKHDLHPSKVIERPKVVYNAATKKFVMWCHIDTSDYAYARVGVFVADKPTGPYNYLGSVRPGGYDSRDFTLFQDDDQKAYLLFSSSGTKDPASYEDWNQTLRLAKLSDDYLEVEAVLAEVRPNAKREAPVVFKHGGLYHLVTSGCTGWDPNAAEHSSTPTLTGPWTVHGNPCVGAGRDTTFGGQGTFILPNGKDNFILMADVWKKEDLRNSSYLWLAARFENDTLIVKPPA